MNHCNVSPRLTIVSCNRSNDTPSIFSDSAILKVLSAIVRETNVYLTTCSVRNTSNTSSRFSKKDNNYFQVVFSSFQKRQKVKKSNQFWQKITERICIPIAKKPSLGVSDVTVSSGGPHINRIKHDCFIVINMMSLFYNQARQKSFQQEQWPSLRRLFRQVSFKLLQAQRSKAKASNLSIQLQSQNTGR